MHFKLKIEIVFCYSIEETLSKTELKISRVKTF